MSDTLAEVSLIQDILDFAVKFRRPPIGLNYVIYATTSFSGSKDSTPEVRPLVTSSNRKYLQKLLKQFSGPSKTAEEQLLLWDRLLPKIHTSLLVLDHALVETGQGENVRVVLDVDMGGYFYSRIGTHAILFGSTIDQAQINNGTCDREMNQMVSEIQAVFTAHGT
jgi:hypothetical protein